MKDSRSAPDGFEQELNEIINEVRMEQHATPAAPKARGMTAAPPRPAAKRPPAPEGRRRAGGKAGRLAGIIAAAAVVALLAAVTGYTYLYPDIHYGIKAGSVPIGGMDEAAAARAIDEGCAPLIAGKTVTLSIYGKEYPVEIGAVTTGMDSAGTAAEAYAYTHEGGFFTRVGHVLSALFGRHEVPLAVAVDHGALTARLDEISAEALTAPVDPTWSIAGDQLVIDRGEPGVDFDRATVDRAVTERIRAMDFEPYEVEVRAEAQKPVDLEAIKAAADAQAKNATVDKSDGKTVIDAVDGVEVDLDAAQKALDAAGAGERSVSVTIKRTPAAVNADTLRQVLFRDTLATSKTSFASSGAARANNVRLASSYINGTILNPGEEFSYNGVVGERTTARGFKPAGAYVAGQLVDEVGGGVCQPSSTLYMAVLRADLAVTERTNHGFTVAYTPLGEDATVSYGSLDFRFKNSTDYPIKLVADSSGGTLRMTIIGTKTTDKSVTTDRKVVKTYEPETVEQKDASIDAGKTEVKQGGQTGYKVETYKVITENGKTTTVKANTSTYKKKDKIVLVGTKPVQAAPPAQAETPPAQQPASGGGDGAQQGEGDPE
ncbi:VanW family protein [Intestinibacillus massiliensis]|nr:VanW family protein [Intestinibacillus massiliensis]